VEYKYIQPSIDLPALFDNDDVFNASLINAGITLKCHQMPFNAGIALNNVKECYNIYIDPSVIR
jgi:hypothetical protein